MMRFTLRDLFWLTLLAGVCVWFWLYDRKLHNEVAAAKSVFIGDVIQEIAANGGASNVHWLNFTYSQYLGFEYEIGWVDKQHQIRKRADRSGTIQPTWFKLLKD